MTEPPDIGKAYLFWLPSLFGCAGLHRFYLGHPLSGVVYLMTWGLFGLGTLHDALYMQRLVRRARREWRFEHLPDEPESLPLHERRAPRRKPDPGELELEILALAEQREGVRWTSWSNRATPNSASRATGAWSTRFPNS